MITLMEICGTHTATAVKYGLRALLPRDVRLVSGPGCPVCVTPARAVDALCDLAQTNAVVTFGDLMRVRGARGSLADAKANGGDVRVVYSPFDILSFAEREPEKNFIMAAVGFETTVPVYAALLERAAEKGIKRIQLFTALKTMPHAIRFICESQSPPDGFIAPGHVAAVTGAGAFSFIGDDYRKPCVVAGFSPEEMLDAIRALVEQIRNDAYAVQNFYPKAVTESGQPVALALMDKYFESCDAHWRGIGNIEGSGLRLRPAYRRFDAGLDYAGNGNARSDNAYDGALPRLLPEADEALTPGCRCGEVMLGEILPPECALFGKRCTPANPVGACMVTGEGACGVFYNGGVEH